MQIIVDQLLVQYELSGKGKLIVLLHGWGDSSRTFNSMQTALVKNYEVLAINLPGFGGSQQPPTAWGLSDYSGFIRSLLLKLDKQAYAIIGHSNGGAIAIHGLASAELQAKRLVLLASAGIRGEAKARNRALLVVVKGGKLLSMPLPARLKRNLRATSYKMVGSDMLVVEELQESFKKIVAEDVRLEAKKIHIPTLIIYGDQDKATPPRFGKLFNAAITSSSLYVFAGGGHFIHHEKPDDVERLIKEFLV
jgi:pimeloyl-ACP methyl ester carboxylesterase